jgi:signal transduction histidine kinase
VTSQGFKSNNEPKVRVEAFGAEEMPPQELGLDMEKIENLILRISKDKDGIPVIYDAFTHERGLDKPAEISILSHELLAPLTLIKGYTATLLHLNNAINEEQKDRYLRGIESAANKLIRLLENIRDLVQLEDTQSFTYDPTSLSHVIQQIVSEMQSQTTTHLIKFSRFSSLPKVNINRQKIEQIITNLLSNAIKYSPEGIDIEIDINQVRNQSELEKLFGTVPKIRFPCLIVSISDSGSGIPETELERIFDRSYRLDNRLTRTTKGFGFGLFICKVIVEAHGGQIWARNRAQGGSTFYFSLPLE